MKLDDAVVVVTGGASGLGEGVVRAVVSKGGKAVIFDRYLALYPYCFCF